MLAADGFIEEMITTNYDCGIEAAWKALAPRSGPRHEERLRVVTRPTGMDRPRPRWQQAAPILYKINGCAGELKAAIEREQYDPRAAQEAAERILLTESQIQGFRGAGDRQWVRDLIRDRTRSRVLVLSGFGSDEPQVWHLIRAVQEELAALAGRTDGTSDASRDHRPYDNDPHREADKRPRMWAVLYGQKIPFHILSALLDEADIRDLRRRDACSSEGRKAERRFLLDNFFSGYAAEQFRARPWSGGRLDAGDFWRWVWTKTLERSLEDREGRVAQTFVQAVLGRPPRAADPEARTLFELWASLVKNYFFEIPLDEPRTLSACSRWHLRCEKDAPGAPGMAWDGTRYLPVHEEPTYWTQVALLAAVKAEELGRDKGKKSPAEQEDSGADGPPRPRVSVELRVVREGVEPVPVLALGGYHPGALDADAWKRVRTLAAPGRGAAQGRAKEKTVNLHVGIPLTALLRRRKGCAELQANVWSYVRDVDELNPEVFRQAFVDGLHRFVRAHGLHAARQEERDLIGSRRQPVAAKSPQQSEGTGNHDRRDQERR